MAKFHLYKDKSGQFRWRLRASNGKILADSAEGYVEKADCEHGIELVKGEGPAAPIEDES